MKFAGNFEKNEFIAFGQSQGRRQRAEAHRKDARPFALASALARRSSCSPAVALSSARVYLLNYAIIKVPPVRVFGFTRLPPPLWESVLAGQGQPRTARYSWSASRIWSVR
jgi:hypothetical protein